MFFFLQATNTTVTDTMQGIADTVAGSEKISYFGLLFKGGFMMIPLILLLFVAVFFIIERFLYIQKKAQLSESLVNEVLDQLYQGNIKGAEALCISDKSSLGNVLRGGVSQLGKPIEHIEKVLDIQSNIELNEMENHTSYISMISGIAPRLGFIGTILGVIRIFYDIASSGGNIAIGTITTGLYQKMITSGMGLIVGVIAFMGFHFLISKIDNYSMKLQKQIFEFVKGIQKPVN